MAARSETSRTILLPDGQGRRTEYPYRLIRSARKTLAAEVTSEGVVVRAPMRCPVPAVETFLIRHASWLKRQLRRAETRAAAHPEPDDAAKAEFVRRAKEELPVLTSRYAEIMGVSFSGVRVTSAKKRFGSCSPENGICYSWRLMQYPREAVEYVVVHELAHVRHKNHSAAFYREVERYLPDWRMRAELLKR